MDESNSLTDLERGKEDCVMRFADGKSFRVDYLEIRLTCLAQNAVLDKKMNRGLLNSERRS